MNDKNIKKQPSAQTLRNDKLEGISGGFSEIGNALLLSQKEQQCLDEDQSWKADYKGPMEISSDALAQAENHRKKDVLKKHGFTETPLF